MENKTITKACSYDRHLARLLTSIQEDLFENIPCFIAGGSALKLYLNQELDLSDIDIWFRNQDDYNNAVTILRQDHKWRASTSNSETYVLKPGSFKTTNEHDLKIQLIKTKFYDTAHDLVLGDFDFTICQVAFSGGVLTLSAAAYEDIASGVLRGNQNYLGEISPMRYLKYMHRGYTPTIDLYDTVFIQDRTSLSIGEMNIPESEAFYG